MFSLMFVITFVIPKRTQKTAKTLKKPLDESVNS